MKLTQSQRADLLAQFFSARATACLPVSEKMNDAKEMLQAYEDELASWPEPVHAVEERARAMAYVSDVPSPLTEEQAAAHNRRFSRFMENPPATSKPLRNPENIDFSKYPIPPEYTVASEEDCKEASAHIPAGWCQFTGLGWYKFKTSYTKPHDNWTYLRPLRKGEKGVSV